MFYLVPYLSESLSHSGAKGMKWGVRRWQNYDGSLTDAGRIHYGYGPKRQSQQKYGSASNKEIVSTSGKVMRDSNGHYTKDAYNVALPKASRLFDFGLKDYDDSSIVRAYMSKADKSALDQLWKRAEDDVEEKKYAQMMRHIMKGNNILKLQEAFPGKKHGELEKIVHEMARQKAAEEIRQERFDYDYDYGSSQSNNDKYQQTLKALKKEHADLLKVKDADPELLELLEMEISRYQYPSNIVGPR